MLPAYMLTRMAGRIQHSCKGVTMSEGLQPKMIKHYSMMWWVILCGAMMLVTLLFGTIPVLISYRKIMSK